MPVTPRLGPRLQLEWLTIRMMITNNLNRLRLENLGLSISHQYAGCLWLPGPALGRQRQWPSVVKHQPGFSLASPSRQGLAYALGVARVLQTAKEPNRWEMGWPEGRA